MIIVEGFDNTGKSRLAQHLSKMFDLPVVKRIRPPVSKQNFIMETLAFLCLNPSAIFDRFPVISEAVYGPILRDENALDDESISWKFYLDKLVQCKPLIIYCRPDQSKIFSFESRDQMEGVIEKKTYLLKDYDSLMEMYKNRLSIVKYDYTSLIEPTQIELVVKAYLIAGGLR